MPQKLLYRTQVSAAFKQMTGKGVSEHMRVAVAVETLGLSEFLESHLYGTWRDTFAA